MYPVPKRPRLRPVQAEALLLRAGFNLVRSKDSHRIYMRGTARIVLPFHAGKELHPKVVKQVLEMLKAET